MEFIAHESERIASVSLQDKAEITIRNQLRLKKHFSCSFCHGYGHGVKECATMKKINKYTRTGSKAQEIAWGKEKSLKVAERIKEASTMKLVGIRRGYLRSVTENVNALGFEMKVKGVP